MIFINIFTCEQSRDDAFIALAQKNFCETISEEAARPKNGHAIFSKTLTFAKPVILSSQPSIKIYVTELTAYLHKNLYSERVLGAVCVLSVIRRAG